MNEGGMNDALSPCTRGSGSTILYTTWHIDSGIFARGF